MIVKLLTEHHLEFLSLKIGCRGSSEPTHVKMPHCWKSQALAQLYLPKYFFEYTYLNNECNVNRQLLSLSHNTCTKKCIRKWCLLKLSAACKCSRQGFISAYRQTLWTQIRLILWEQSDLSPPCFLVSRFKWTKRRCTRRHFVVVSSRRI